MSRYQLDHGSVPEQAPGSDASNYNLDIKTGWRVDGLSGLLPARVMPVDGGWTAR
jgi:hypothetical protein